jgi:hypothetical protein
LSRWQELIDWQAAGVTSMACVYPHTVSCLVFYQSDLEEYNLIWAWWFPCVIPALKKLKQDGEFQASLD